MSLNAIVLRKDQGGLEFHFDGCGPFTPTHVGKAIVVALLQGNEHINVGWGGLDDCRNPTVNYAIGMLRYAGKTGTFWDDEEGGDHDFDLNTPTPGDRWAEVQDLRKRAKTIAYEARDIRDSEELGHCAPMWAEIAEEYSAAADALDLSKLGLRPLRGSLTVPQAKLWDRRIGADAIWWDAGNRVFKFGGYYVSTTILGRMIANSLLRGDEWVKVGEIDVTVNYLVQMCREVGRHGEFVDYTDEEFDPNVAPDMAA